LLRSHNFAAFSDHRNGDYLLRKRFLIGVFVLVLVGGAFALWPLIESPKDALFPAPDNIFGLSERLEPLDDGEFSIIVWPDTDSLTASRPLTLGTTRFANPYAAFYEHIMNVGWPQVLREPFNMESWEFPLLSLRTLKMWYSDADFDKSWRLSILPRMSDWIVSQVVPQRVVYVGHVGDLVHTPYLEDQWQLIAPEVFKVAKSVAIGVVPGNHDLYRELGQGECENASKFWQSFSNSALQTAAEFRAEYDSYLSSYYIIEATNPKLLVLNLMLTPPDDHLTWAEKVLISHPDHFVILITHMWLGGKYGKSPELNDDNLGLMNWLKCDYGGRGNTPRQMWEKLFKRYKNVGLILSGDQGHVQTLYRQGKGDHGNTVHQIITDYSTEPDRGCIRVLRFRPTKNRIEVRTVSTLREGACRSTNLRPDPQLHNFDIVTDMFENVR
jgi:hypothetical protein